MKVRPSDEARAHLTPRRAVRFLDECPELASRLAPDARGAVRESLVLPTLDVSSGAVAVQDVLEAPGVHGPVTGLYVAHGLLAAELVLQERVCSRILTPGDFVLFDGVDDDSLPDRRRLLAHTDATVVVLDERLLAAFGRWPKLSLGLTHRLAVQAHRAHRAQAIAQLPRVEDRLLGLLWMLADELGHVRADGVLVGAELTHETLGQMIGARRPTVTLGLHSLVTKGDLQVAEGGWVLSPASLERFATGAAELQSTSVSLGARP